MNTCFARADVAAACLKYGSELSALPSGLVGSQVLWGLSGVESTFGFNCTPRHEPAFDVGGSLGKSGPMPGLLAKFGSAAACSYGPLQLMFCNAPAGYVPDDFGDLDKAFIASVADLNSKLRRFKPSTLAEIGEIWNTGHIANDPEYVARLAQAYSTPLP